MFIIDEKIKINNLIDVYGSMLTKKQENVTRNYYQFDNSLSEIADELKISRQAVHDMISKSVNILNNFEEKLNFCQKLVYVKTSLLDLASNVGDLQKKEIEKIINNI